MLRTTYLLQASLGLLTSTLSVVARVGETFESLRAQAPGSFTLDQYQISLGYVILSKSDYLNMFYRNLALGLRRLVRRIIGRGFGEQL